jgi:inner membrane protein
MNRLWYIWFILAALLVVAEIFTSGFVLLWFGVGALVAGVLALSGIAGLPVQVAVFLLVAILLTFASRRLFERLVLHGSPGGELKTGVETLPGRTGVVVEASSGVTREGAVRIFGSTWRAFPIEEDDEELQKGEKVIVERVEGASLYVRHADRQPSYHSTKS